MVGGFQYNHFLAVDNSYFLIPGEGATKVPKDSPSWIWVVQIGYGCFTITKWYKMAFNFSHTQTRIPAGCQEPHQLSSGSMKGLWMAMRVRKFPWSIWWWYGEKTAVVTTYWFYLSRRRIAICLKCHAESGKGGKASAKPRRSADDSCPTFGSVPQREGSLQPAGLKCNDASTQSPREHVTGIIQGKTFFAFLFLSVSGLRQIY